MINPNELRNFEIAGNIDEKNQNATFRDATELTIWRVCLLLFGKNDCKVLNSESKINQNSNFIAIASFINVEFSK